MRARYLLYRGIHLFAMRIVSLLPAATEILYAIGAGDCVVGVTHECDFPPEAAYKPALIRPRVDPEAAPAEIDRQVHELIERGESLYAVDAERLLDLAPDLIVTQDLCQVCAASPEELASALARLTPDRSPRVLTFTPHTVADVCEGIRQIGKAARRTAEAQFLAERLARCAAAVAHATARISKRPGVLCLEWFDPPYVAGHWVPEMVRLAGGTDLFGREGQPSFQVEWQQVLAAGPEVVVLMPCGCGLERNLETWRATKLPQNWNDLPAVRSGRVYAVDANAYFSRPGPRLTEGLGLLASLLHPERAFWGLPAASCEAVRRLSVAAGAR
jgi:iron complex transport system substrate-binding protein